ncbi:MAG: SDR family oxidoreductase [Pseudomonadota bacterium]
MADMTYNEHGRLAGRVALVTGAAGNLGGEIVRRYLAEGALVALSGRSADRLEAARRAALEDTGAPDERAVAVVMDGADPDAVRAGLEELIARFGKLDVLVNNAGSAGPKQPLERLPFTADDLEALGGADAETVGDAMRNILGVTWNLSRLAAPMLHPGASIVNVSTIFSRTKYFGRTAYVVPKAALNALSKTLAEELGPKGVRVNTIYPGPIESDRIRNAFAAMDGLRGAETGTTANEFTDTMSLARDAGREPPKSFPRPEDVANACVFLGSNESAAFNGHDIEVTHGMSTPDDRASTCIARPSLRVVDAGGMTVLVAAGNQVADALQIARIQAECGADVILGFTFEGDVQAARSMMDDGEIDARIYATRCDRRNTEETEAVLAKGHPSGAPVSAAIVLPSYGAGLLKGPLSEATDNDVKVFLDHELSGAVALARSLTRYWMNHDDLAHDPRFVFMTNGPDGANGYARCLAAGMEQLVRVWRDETETDVGLGRRNRVEWGNQIIRYGNAEVENLPFAAAQASSLLFSQRRIPEVDLELPASIAEITGAKRALGGYTENIAGLHLGKVALITGASMGIGGQIARLLALSGGKVMLTARREAELEAMRNQIIGELKDIGYSGAERRIHMLAGIDVGDLRTLRRAVEATLKAFGKIDYLINNAGVSGAEEMVVDMPLDAWRFTLDANLVSNFALISEVAPIMRAQGYGYVVNVSSYFGGEKYVAVSYPNRADYAVSKAGQRAMVETMAGALGPEIQFNAIAPGPVDGVRLQGVGGRPGLFQRRARLILMNKRLNAVHAAAVAAHRRGAVLQNFLARAALNDVDALMDDPKSPTELRDLAGKCRAEGDATCTWGDYLMTEDMAARLVDRLANGGYLGAAAALRDKRGAWLDRTPPEDKDFLPKAKIDKTAKGVGDSVLSLLNLGRMPTEEEVALGTVFFLADRAASGQTFQPSGGLALERSITERELFGSTKPERIAAMAGKTVWLIGEHLTDHLAETARSLVEDCDVGAVRFLMRSEAGCDRMRDALTDLPGDRLHYAACHGDLERAMDAALAAGGPPTTVVSTPFMELPDVLFGGPGEDRLDPMQFRELIEDNLTHHFRVTRKAVLIDGSQLVLVTPDVAEGSRPPAFSLANFFKTSLHAFTATVAVESERLVHDTPVNQINLTRRARAEEPRNANERAEEIKRFARAVVLAGAPLPDAEDSRYRARIYRGMAITV